MFLLNIGKKRKSTVTASVFLYNFVE